MKQTAIEWLEEQYYESEGKLTRHDFEQAKQIEKEEMESAYFCGSCDRMNDEGSFEEYYNETYGNTK